MEGKSPFSGMAINYKELAAELSSHIKADLPAILSEANKHELSTLQTDIDGHSEQIYIYIY